MIFFPERKVQETILCKCNQEKKKIWIDKNRTHKDIINIVEEISKMEKYKYECLKYINYFQINSLSLLPNQLDAIIILFIWQNIKAESLRILRKKIKKKDFPYKITSIK